MDQIEEVRRKTDIVQLISEAVTLKKAGRNFRALCPFHEEKTPSFMVSPERQMFKCFGCQKGGDAFKFVMERERLEFGETLRLLADRAGVQLKEYRPGPDQQIKEKLLEINHLASEFYHFLLTEHKLGKPALDYLLKRGITKSSIKTFKLGFAADEWESLRRYLTKKKNYQDEDLERAGLVIKGQKGFYDRFRARIMFPLFDHRNRVVGFSGRVLASETKEAKYVNSPETLLYHKSEVLYGLETTKEAIKKANKAVVTEGELDAISSYQAGVTNVVAIKGSALTIEQIDLLKRFCEHLVLALDMDTAGDAASRRGIELAEAKGLNVRVIRLAYGKDPDECAQHSARLWKDSVKAAVPVYDFYIESAKKRFGVATPEGKRQISDELSPLLSRISNQVIKAHYVKKLAGVLGVSEDAVSQEVSKKFTPRASSEAEPTRKPETSQTRQERLEQYLLSLILQLDKTMAATVRRIDWRWLGAGAVGQIGTKLQQWFKKQTSWEINRFVKDLPEELVGAIDSAYLTDLKQLNGDEPGLIKEIDKTLTELNKLATKTKLTQLTQALKEATKQKDEVKRKALEQELVETTRLLSYNHD
ncbi:DNA primase [Patescibacteria group bacterium]|nr:DNA primase [Patescibacteria group bacterium]